MNDARRAKIAPRATVRSDVARARTIVVTALGAACGGVVAFAATPASAPLRASTPAHSNARVACATCHAGADEVARATFAASGACRTCHGESDHVSTRAGHRALAAKGELACATCHPAHGQAQGITFGQAGVYSRWTAGADASGVHAGAVAAGTTVPLVALSACARCHDPTSPSDPVAACVSPATRRGDTRLDRTASGCFDEHPRKATRAVCARQHEGPRIVAWDVARDVAATTPWVAAESPRGHAWLATPLASFGGAIAFGLTASAVLRRQRKQVRTKGGALEAPVAKKRLPVIDTSTCLGCYACVDACPFDVLTIDRYVAVVARPEECCGVVLCAQVCPNGSLTIDEGDASRPEAIAIDENLESREVPGLFVAGDLTGLPLIKNAIHQGVRAMDQVASSLGRKRSPMDVVVVGAGPAGLAAALRAKEKGLTAVVLEQATVAASIKSFPRDKLVHDPPLDLPVEGELWLREATKEEIVAQWTRIVRVRQIDVREGQRVTGIDRAGGVFTVTSERGDTWTAPHVIVAIGRRGTPRPLGVPIDPGAESHVHYALADARSFAGKRVVVVGLGDTAMEAAIALARQPKTHVTIAYRGKTFGRGKARNIAEVRDLADKGRLALSFESVPVAVTASAVELQTPSGRRLLPYDAVFVLIGGIPSWDLLTRAGLSAPAM